MRNKNILTISLLVLSSVVMTKAQVSIGKESITNSSVLLEFNDQRTINPNGQQKGIILPHVKNLDVAAINGTLAFHLDEKSYNALKVKRDGIWELLSSVNTQTIMTPSYTETSSSSSGLIIGESKQPITGPVRITDVNVRVNIKHTYVSDVVLSLVAPNNNSVILFNKTGGGGDDFTNTLFDDQASSVISSASAPFTGSFQLAVNSSSSATIDPSTNKLSKFNTIDPNGNWQLKMEDYAGGDNGILNSWSIEYCYESIADPTNKDCSVAKTNQEVPFDDTNQGANAAVSTISVNTDPSIIKHGLLALKGDNKAMVLPNVNGVQNFPNPTSGMLVYDTVRKALAFFNGKEWSFIVAK